jgi:hypothetical protein
VVVAIVGPGQIAFRTLGEWLGDVSHEERLALEEPTKACVVGISKETSIPIVKIGITVFVVLKSRFHLWHGVQKRMVRIRLDSNPVPTQIKWTRKKGLLGECWTQRRDARLNHPEHFGSHLNCTKAQWKLLPQVVTTNLSYEDFKQIRHYGFALASPMTDSHGHYRGCIVVQVPAEFEQELDSPEILELIHTAAQCTCAVLN